MRDELAEANTRLKGCYSIMGEAGLDWPEIVADVLAYAGLLIQAHDAGDEAMRDLYIDDLRVAVTAWCSPRDMPIEVALDYAPHVRARAG